MASAAIVAMGKGKQWQQARLPVRISTNWDPFVGVLMKRAALLGPECWVENLCG